MESVSITSTHSGYSTGQNPVTWLPLPAREAGKYSPVLVQEEEVNNLWTATSLCHKSHLYVYVCVSAFWRKSKRNVFAFAKEPLNLLDYFTPQFSQTLSWQQHWIWFVQALKTRRKILFSENMDYFPGTEGSLISHHDFYLFLIEVTLVYNISFRCTTLYSTSVYPTVYLPPKI